MVSGDYTVPVTVNGYSCRNCTDVGYANRQIDPAHPQSGPNNANAANDPSQPARVRLKLEDAQQVAREPTGYSARGQAGASVALGLVVDRAA